MVENTLHFEDLSFQELEDVLIVRLLNTFKTEIPLKDLKNIGLTHTESHRLSFSPAGKPQRFYYLLDKAMSSLVHSINGKKAVYIHEHSNIPLVGSQEFGVIDRDTNVLEIRPVTGCNLACVFCSVDEGPNNKEYDYVVQAEYLASVTAELAAKKKHPVEVQYGPMGEPLLYTPLVALTKLLSAIPQVKEISMKTNGVNLTKKLIDALAEAGMTRMNVSLNAITQEVATRMAGKTYPVKHVMEMCEYGATKMDVLIAPTIVPGMNDEEIPALAAFGKSLTKSGTMGFQNFLEYKRGRNPTKQRSFESFFKMLEPHEEPGFILTPKEGFNPFRIVDDKSLTKPMKKGDILKLELVMPGRYPYERLAVAHDRVITVRTDKPLGTKVSVKIIRDKYNIFVAVPN